MRAPEAILDVIYLLIVVVFILGFFALCLMVLPVTMHFARLLRAKVQLERVLATRRPETFKLLRGKGFGNHLGFAFELERFANQREEDLDLVVKASKDDFRLACELFRFDLRQMVWLGLLTFGTGTLVFCGLSKLVP